KTPWEFLMMRRTIEDGEKLLDEALAKLRASRERR
ncbi:MAG: polymerase-binding protein, partial [Frankiaceae bacterium]|nr:polymerase-binding protein [Frankiaceae bacterium]